MTSLTFYGGVNEIGGNKILLEDKDTKVFLDLGKGFNRSYSTNRHWFCWFCFIRSNLLWQSALSFVPITSSKIMIAILKISIWSHQKDLKTIPPYLIWKIVVIISSYKQRFTICTGLMYPRFLRNLCGQLLTVRIKCQIKLLMGWSLY